MWGLILRVLGEAFVHYFVIRRWGFLVVGHPWNWVEGEARACQGPTYRTDEKLCAIHECACLQSEQRTRNGKQHFVWTYFSSHTYALSLDGLKWARPRGSRRTKSTSALWIAM